MSPLPLCLGLVVGFAAGALSAKAVDEGRQWLGFGSICLTVISTVLLCLGFGWRA